MLDTTGTSFLAEGTSNAKRDVHNRPEEYGNSIFDARHRLVVSYLVELPFHGSVAGGWQVSGVTTFQTGTPVDAGMSFDNANTGSTGDNRPDRIGYSQHRAENAATVVQHRRLRYARAVDVRQHRQGRDHRARLQEHRPVADQERGVRLRQQAAAAVRSVQFIQNNTNFSPPNATFGNAQFGVILVGGRSSRDPAGIQARLLANSARLGAEENNVTRKLHFAVVVLGGRDRRRSTPRARGGACCRPNRRSGARRREQRDDADARRRAARRRYLPACGAGPFPVLLTSTPYSKNGRARRGDSRARLRRRRRRFSRAMRSKGEWQPYIDEGQDGFDTQQWIGQQPWSDGKVGMFGRSYPGYTQVASAPYRSGTSKRSCRKRRSRPTTTRSGR